jgi:hypothetical protein
MTNKTLDPLFQELFNCLFLDNAQPKEYNKTMENTTKECCRGCGTPGGGYDLCDDCCDKMAQEYENNKELENPLNSFDCKEVDPI